MFSFRWLQVSVVFGASLFSGLEVWADLIIATPSELSPGDQFRIVFLTLGTTEATSSDIAFYNNFVTADAEHQAGGAGNQVVCGGAVLTWSAIGSTYCVSATANIGAFGVPVFLASGTRVADSDDSSGLDSERRSITGPHSVNRLMAA